MLYSVRGFNLLLQGYDNRCLKPEENKAPEKWDHYDPDDFYNAINKEIKLKLNLLNEYCSPALQSSS